MDSYFSRYLVLTGLRSCILLPEAYVQQYVIYVLVCIEFTADSVQLSLQMDQQQQWMYNSTRHCKFPVLKPILLLL